jgi:hypothetical protein
MTDAHAHDVTCQEAIGLLGEYCDGNLSPEVCRALLVHLDLCGPCVDFVNTYRATPRVARAALTAEMPRELKDRLKQFLASHRKP